MDEGLGARGSNSQLEMIPFDESERKIRSSSGTERKPLTAAVTVTFFPPFELG
jgi:hypothetical protein